MKRSTIILLVVAGVLVLWAIFAQRGFVSKEEKVNKAWADVQSSYQRRFDLIPNLQAIVEGAADFEKSTLTAVIEARAKATSVNIDASNLTPENIQKFQEAQTQFSSSLSRLLVSVEQYPQLTATQNFKDFQVELAGTENRINRARDLFNEAVQSYNTSIRMFPGNILAGLFGFEKKGSFAADAGAQNAPKIDFKKEK
ncbi:MAG: LemA family protein [Bacteroidota bacterium]